jgi:hypothetical protein
VRLFFAATALLFRLGLIEQEFLGLALVVGVVGKTKREILL